MAIRFDQGVSGARLAYLRDGAMEEVGPCGFFWLGGFMSEMTGAKAEAIAELARSSRRNALRFDYSGHGQSDGLFTDGTISFWLEQATHMFLRQTKNRRIVVGSSMGGWLALLMVRKLAQEEPAALRRISGLVLIAPATDMTRDLMWDEFSPAARQSLKERGLWDMPSGYGNAYPITMKLIEDGDRHLLFPRGMDVNIPVRILQGSEDEDVPAAHAIKTMNILRGGDVSTHIIKGGNHRLSSPTELRIIRETALNLAERADGVIV
jgi:pimeloyl-ACP methyl ester carboxylesterase